MSRIYLRIVLSVFAMVASAGVVAAQDNLEALEENAVRNAVDTIADSVIRFETIGGANRVDGVVVSNGPSTGVVVSTDGYVVSSSFHFAHQPASIFARLPNGQRAVAEIVGKDQSRKIVLLKIQSDFEFQVPPSVDADQVPVGATVVAVGRVFDAETPSVSTGIMSAKNRVWGRAIQTDAKISPANFGGPLLDLRGHVIGILVPLSPDDDGEMAGTDWYDSGIGFAVSFKNVLKQLDRLKAGETLRKGLAGISLQGSDIYAQPAIVAYCQGTSPAGKVGIRSGDEIVEINGRAITRQAEMKHALGPLYEGDVANIVVKREDDRLSFDVELVGEIEPFVPRAIGLIVDEELIVQRVFAESESDVAGVQTADRVVKFNGEAISDRDDLRLRIAAAEIGSTVEIDVLRGEKSSTLEVVVGKMNADHGSGDEWEPTSERKSRMITISVAESANQCFAIVPQMLENESAPGLLVWIPAPGKLKKETIEEIWREPCRAKNVVVLVPESTNQKRWRPDDIEFIVSAVESLGRNVPLDRTRVVVGGLKTGGAMASLTGFSHRDLFSGLVLIHSGISQRVGKVTTSPVEPMMVLMGATTKLDEKQKSTLERLEKAHLPVHVLRKVGSEKVSAWCGDVLDWVNAVNRL